MGSASLIASAISLILLIITAYVIIGGTISSAEIVATAQSVQAQQQETRMRTHITIEGTSLTAGASPLNIQVKNSGSEIISDLDYMDAYLVITDEPIYCPYGLGNEKLHLVSIAPDSIHPNMLDPDEVATFSIEYSGVNPPVWVQITTANGVSDSTYI